MAPRIGPSSDDFREQLEMCSRELRETLEQQAATSEILRAISDSPTELQPILDAVGENAARLCKADNSVIFRVDGGLLRQVSSYGGLATSSHPTQGLPIDRDRVTSRAVFDRETIHVHDLSVADQEFPQGSKDARRDGHRTTLATPLLLKGAPLGAILIRRLEVRPFTDRQIKLLETFANQAAIAIENVRLFSEIQDKSRQVEHQREQLAEWNHLLEVRVAEQVSQVTRLSKLTRYLSPTISELIMSGAVDDPLTTRRSDITAANIDLRGFTEFTETADPEEVMTVLREYHAELGRAVMDHHGTIEHFAGDSAMILYNAPVTIADHELQAVRMALQIRDSLVRLSASWRKRGYQLGFGIGIASGYATLGTIGFEQRLDYGAIGTVCNLAARLCGEATSGQVLISPRVYAKLEPQLDVTPIGELTLKGFHRPVEAYNVIGVRKVGLR